jgi:phosphoribosylformylglycinamidine synthase
MIGVSISSGINPRYGKISPYWMAASVIDEAIRNNVAVGGRRIALLDNFTWGSPEYRDRIGSLVEACKACYDFGIAYGTPFISGKDSLYNESPLGPIVPTLLITALGIVPSVEGVVTMDLKAAGNRLYVVGETAPELGGSEYYHVLGYLGASVPRLDASKTSTSYRRLTAAIDAGYVRACHDLSEGGLAVSLAEMAFTGGLGLDVDIAKVPVTAEMREDLLLFSESNGRLLAEVSEGDAGAFEGLMKGSTIAWIGSVVKEPRLRVTEKGKTVIDLANEETIKAWKTPLEARR